MIGDLFMADFPVGKVLDMNRRLRSAVLHVTSGQQCCVVGLFLQIHCRSHWYNV